MSECVIQNQYNFFAILSNSSAKHQYTEDYHFVSYFIMWGTQKIKEYVKHLSDFSYYEISSIIWFLNNINRLT